MNPDRHDLTPSDILTLLSELNDRLAAIDVKATVIMAGGAVMTIKYGSRFTTQDVDAIFEPSSEIRDAVAAIANEHDLETDWLNDGVKGFINPKTMDSEDLLSLSNLKVECFDAESMLSMKLTSARFDEEKDFLDAITLMDYLGIENINEAFDVIERHAYPSQMTPKSEYFTIEAFERYRKQCLGHISHDEDQGEHFCQNF